MKSWEVSQKLESFFTGGSVYFSQDLSRGYSLIDSSLVTFEVPSFRVLSRSLEDILEFALCPNDILVTYGEDDLLVYRTEPEIVIKSSSRVVSLKADKRGLVVTGGSDNSVKVYQISQGYLTHKFKHKQPVVSVSFFEEELWVASSSLDNTLKIWDLAGYTLLHSINVVNTIRFLSVDSQFLFAASTSELIRFKTGTWKKKTLEVQVESMAGGPKLVIGNQEGEVLLVNKRKLAVKNKKKISDHGIKSLQFIGKELFAANQELSVYLLNKKLEVFKELVGHLDEVLDLKVINKEEVLICLNSTESKILKISDFSVRSLKGHKDNILCSDVQGDLIVTGGKDKIINLYSLNSLKSTFRGHTDEVTSVSFSKSDWFVSSSLDLTLKIWQKSEVNPESSLFTTVAHSKDISSVKVSSDGKTIASSSQDKSIKLWSCKLTLKKELIGHKRGVWDLNFHQNEHLLVSSSGDMTIKVWDLSTYDCIRTLEGNQNSILKVLFCNSVIASASSDGLLKIWDFKTGTCLQTSEAHNGKIWALALLKSEQSLLITGGTDSCVQIWKDVTEELTEKAMNEKKEVIKLEQDLQVAIKNGSNVEAALLAFRLKRPKALFGVVACMRKEEVCNFVDGLMESEEGMRALLTHVRDWNCLKKYSAVAQVVLVEIIDRVPGEILGKEKDLLEGILAYSKRHFERAERIYKDSFLVEHLMNEMMLMPKKDTEDVLIKRSRIEIS